MADEQHPDWISNELRRAALTERAPTHLRLRIDEMARHQSRRPARRRILIPAVGLLAVIVLALLVVLPGGTPGAPTVAQAAALTARPFSGTLSGTETNAYAGFAAVRFPRALDEGRWKVVSSRVARLDGRRILVISYSHGSHRISYAVAATPRLRGQKSGFSSFTLDGHPVVSWQESNHSCLLSSANVSRTTLLALARS